MPESKEPRAEILVPPREPTLLGLILKRALSRGGEYGDLFVEERLTLRLRLEDGRMETPVWGHDAGGGIRVVREGITQYVYTDELGEGGLMGAVDSLLRGNSVRAPHDYVPPGRGDVPPLPWMDAVEAMEWLRAADGAARRANPAVFQVVAGYTPVRQRVQILSSLAPYAEDLRTNSTFTVRVLARREGVTAEGTAGAGGPLEQNRMDEAAAARLGREAAETAVRMLEATAAPAGEHTVVITHGWGGVLFHEACGHGLEADIVQRGSSCFAGRLGRRVAAEGISVVDDGTLEGRRGTLRLDDEGNAARRTVLIEKGILRGFLYDVRSALKEGTRSTGNGRRQSYRSLPLPRMTNTFIEAGPYDPAEILQNTRRGVFVANLGGGTVDLARGSFVFSVTEGYLIEDGRVGRPIYGATLVGDGPDLLREIDMVGNDLRFDPGFGACSKEGQVVPAGVGQPTIRIPRLLVGGTEI